jgi:L-fuconolactonase
MKIDAHQHFWHYNPTEYGWINAEMKILKNDFLPSALNKELNAVGFDGCIAVQARQTLDETTWLLNLASEHSFIKGVVGWVDLCSETIEEQLNTFAANPKLVGVRHVVHDEPDDRFMARKDFRQGISLLQKYKLTYDLLLFPKHLPLAAELVHDFPNQKFVLDHIAKPDIKNQGKEPWATDIRKLAENPNVYCKLSGMVTEAHWNSWQTDDFKFYLDTVFEAFGENRLMIGSDWPVCTLGGSYNQILSIVTDYFSHSEKGIQEKVLGNNCSDFYLNR